MLEEVKNIQETVKPVIKRTRRKVVKPEPTVEKTASAKEAITTPDPIAEKKAAQYKRDHVMVKGIFRNLEDPGHSITFPFRKHKVDKIKNYTLHDGKVSELPMMVVDHINTNCATPIYAHIAGTGIVQGSAKESGRYVGLTTVGLNHRYEFKPEGFIHTPSDYDIQKFKQFLKVAVALKEFAHARYYTIDPSANTD